MGIIFFIATKHFQEFFVFRCWKNAFHCWKKLGAQPPEFDSSYGPGLYIFWNIMEYNVNDYIIKTLYITVRSALVN